MAPYLNPYLNVRCSHCMAERGESCLTARGSKTDKPHKVRREASLRRYRRLLAIELRT
jgi:hypothetical protein